MHTIIVVPASKYHGTSGNNYLTTPTVGYSDADMELHKWHYQQLSDSYLYSLAHLIIHFNKLKERWVRENTIRIQNQTLPSKLIGREVDMSKTEKGCSSLVSLSFTSLQKWESQLKEWSRKE